MVTYEPEIIGTYINEYGTVTSINRQFNNDHYTIMHVADIGVGCYHRLDGPAITRYIKFGNDYIVDVESYYIRGRIHRSDLPAVIYYDSSYYPVDWYWIFNTIDCSDRVNLLLSSQTIIPLDWRKWSIEDRMIFKLFSYDSS